MQTLNEIKDDLANEEGYNIWEAIDLVSLSRDSVKINELIKEVATRYAKQALEEAIKEAKVYEHSWYPLDDAIGAIESIKEQLK